MSCLLYASWPWPQTDKVFPLSSKHLRYSVSITKFFAKSMPVEYGRGLLKLAEALVQGSSHHAAEAKEMRDFAAGFLLEGDPKSIALISEADIDKFVLIFWR